MSYVGVRCLNRSLLRPFGTRGFFDQLNTFHEIKTQKYVLPKIIQGTPSQVYDVVSEVSKYHEFIPYCEDSFVNERDDSNKPKVAGLRVGFKQYDERFVCDVDCKSKVGGKEVYVVRAESLSHNLFDILSSQWTISTHPTRKDASTVELLLKFKFKSRLYNSISSIFAKSVTELVMDAFARRVYHLKKAAVLENPQ